MSLKLRDLCRDRVFVWRLQSPWFNL